MTIDSSDWYPRTLQGERDLYANIDAKIDSYKPKYSFLTDPYVTKIHTMCLTFIEGYNTISQNRATSREMTTWFANIVGSKQKNEPVPPAPVFSNFSIPVGATVGIEEQCRKFAALMKEQDEYEKADGLNLMIEKGASEPPNLGEAQPVLKITVNLDASVTVAWQKSGFDMLELQYRKAGTDMWQPGVSRTTSPFAFAPTLTTPGAPEKFEFRAVYVIKDARVGLWSDIVSTTVG